MKIEIADITSIKPYENNPRKLSETAIEKVAMSLKEYGFRQPIVVDKDRVIVAGHTRFRASKKLGLKQVPISIIDNLTEEQINAYRIADNRTAEESEWDNELLKMEIKELEAKDFKLDLLGFNDEQLNDILFEEKQGLTDEDEVPETPEEPISKLGDIWKLGNHRVMCGDSSLEENKTKLLNGNNVDMIFTDPPYGVDYVSRVDEKRRKNWGGIKNDELKGSELQNFLSKTIDWFENTYIFCNWQSYPDFLKAYGKPKQVIVWNKKWVGLGKGYRNQYEMCLFYGTLNITTETNLWDIKRDSNYKHPTQKPVALSVRAINNSLLQNRICYDPFLGSGSTLIGCEKTKRICYGFELEPKYCDVIIKRWENFTGKKAELENGQK